MKISFFKEEITEDPKNLMMMAKIGDKTAFDNLYRLYFTPVFRYIYFRLKNKTVTEDLTQDVFIKVYKSIGRFQEKNKTPLAYFFTVARNTLIDYWRKKKEILTNNQDILQTPRQTLEESLKEKEDQKIIYQAIQFLKEEQQTVIILKFINDLTNKEIAGILGKKEETVRQIQCRALKTIRQYLKNKKLI
ncbi:MAG: RNA polymerase sigma factor [Parcubacteria group bacterium]|nr:RNA polymerase sigma factor [Parcubacteria group bacterium]